MTSPSKYGLSRYQLMELMAQRGKDAAERVSEYGGVKAICDQLSSDLKYGLANERADLVARRNEYGANFIKPVPAKWWISLAFDAIQDKTLIILIIAALVSIVLGVTVEEQKVGAWGGREGGRELQGGRREGGSYGREGGRRRGRKNKEDMAKRLL